MAHGVQGARVGLGLAQGYRMSPPNSEEIQRELDRTSEGMRALYDIYVKYLLLSGLAASVLAGFISTRYSAKSSLPD